MRKYPDWKDQEIADQAARYLEIDISRSAVARVRTEKEDKKSGSLVIPVVSILF